MLSKVRDQITYPFAIFVSRTIDDRLMSNFISHYLLDIIFHLS